MRLLGLLSYRLVRLVAIICLAESLVKMFDNKGISMNCFVKTLFINMYAKYRSLETANKIFNELGSCKNSFTL